MRQDRSSPFPLVGEGGSLTRSGSETDEGSVSAERTPHPALRATFSHKGRREHHGLPVDGCTSSVGTPQVPLRTVITRVPGLRPGRTSETSTPA